MPKETGGKRYAKGTPMLREEIKKKTSSGKRKEIR